MPDRSSVVRCERQVKGGGGPERELWERAREERNGVWQREGVAQREAGRDPVRRLWDMSRSSREGREAKKMSGMVPCHKAQKRRRVVRLRVGGERKKEAAAVAIPVPDLSKNADVIAKSNQAWGRGIIQ